MGINVNDAFPSNYLKASDLQGRPLTLSMERIGYEQLGDDNKLVLYFQGKEKGLVLNKTNANNIAAIYGPETDNWIGKEVTLVEAMVDFQGRSTPAIRIRAPRKTPNVNAPLQPSGEGQRPFAPVDDDVDF